MAHGSEHRDAESRRAAQHSLTRGSLGPQWRLPTVKMRAIAWLIDIVFIAVFVQIVGANSPIDFIRVLVATLLIYVAISLGLTDATMGKALLGIRLCALTHEGLPRIERPQALRRYTWLLLIVLRTMGGYLIVLPVSAIRQRRLIPVNIDGQLPHDIAFRTLPVIVLVEDHHPDTPLDRAWSFMDELLASLGRAAKDALKPSAFAGVIVAIVLFVRSGFRWLHRTLESLRRLFRTTEAIGPVTMTAAPSWIMPILTGVAGLCMLGAFAAPLILDERTVETPGEQRQLADSGVDQQHDVQNGQITPEQIRRATQAWARSSFNDPTLDVPQCTRTLELSKWCVLVSETPNYDALLLGGPRQAEQIAAAELFPFPEPCVEVVVQARDTRVEVTQAQVCVDL